VAGALAAATAAGGPGYDAVLLDINMPRMNGDVACAALRGAGWTLPILAVSGTADDPGLVRAAGFSGVLGKPFSLEQLRAALVTNVPAAAVRRE
jgi:CheY-like chemotaxis protein